MANQYFDAGRLNKYIVRQSTLYVNEMMLAIATVFGLLLVVSLLTGYFSDAPVAQSIGSFYVAVYFIAGLVLSSVAFAELNNPHSSYAFLTMPVSSLEKLIGAWLITSVVYSIAYFLVIAVIYGICGVLFPSAFAMSGTFEIPVLEVVGSYMVFQTVFILGATAFVKHNFLKTALSIFIFNIALGLFAGLLFWSLFGNNFQAEETGFEPGQPVKDLLEIGSKVLFWFVFPAFMLVVSYFKLKERQV